MARTPDEQTVLVRQKVAAIRAAVSVYASAAKKLAMLDRKPTAAEKERAIAAAVAVVKAAERL
jgi:hypothetical protein